MIKSEYETVLVFFYLLNKKPCHKDMVNIQRNNSFNKNRAKLAQDGYPTYRSLISTILNSNPIAVTNKYNNSSEKFGFN